PIRGNFSGSRTSGGGSTPPGAGGLVSQGGRMWSQPLPRQMSYNEAAAHCAAATFGGKTGWRLPTAAELLSLFQSGAYLSSWGRNISYTWTQTPNTVVPAGQYGYRAPTTVSLNPDHDGIRVSWATQVETQYATCVN